MPYRGGLPESESLGGCPVRDFSVCLSIVSGREPPGSLAGQGQSLGVRCASPPSVLREPWESCRVPQGGPLASRLPLSTCSDTKQSRLASEPTLVAGAPSALRAQRTGAEVLPEPEPLGHSPLPASQLGKKGRKGSQRPRTSWKLASDGTPIFPVIPASARVES